MSERVYTEYERELAVWVAERDGDKATAEAFGCSEATIRSWRHRAERKVTDDRARDENAAGGKETGGADSLIADDLADVAIPTEDFDGGRGEYVKVLARARILDKFNIGNQYPSQGELRELRAPGAAGLAVGEIVLLGGRKYAEYGDARWCVAERRDGKLMVRPARLRNGEKLSDDRSRIVQKGPEDAPPGYVSPEERQRGHNENIDLMERRAREIREAMTDRCLDTGVGDADGVRRQRSCGDRPLRERASRSPRFLPGE